MGSWLEVENLFMGQSGYQINKKCKIWTMVPLNSTVKSYNEGVVKYWATYPQDMLPMTSKVHKKNQTVLTIKKGGLDIRRLMFHLNYNLAALLGKHP